MKSIPLLLCVLFYVSGLHSQNLSLSGYVYDEKENIPLQGAFVYLDGTTISTSTDSLGHFTIRVKEKINTDLVVSYIGYRNLTVSNPYQYTKPMKILMREDAIKLNEVVIQGKGPFTRKQMLHAFRRAFLGTTRAGRSCKILNEDDIELYYDSKTRTLHAKSIKPLQIENKYLQYNVTFNLDECTVYYTYKTLEEAYQYGMYFMGSTFFTDISKNKERADKHRRKSYNGSAQHLMKTIAANDWKEQNFALYINGIPASPQKYLKVTDTLGLKKVAMQIEPKKVKPLHIEIMGMSEEQVKKVKEASQNRTEKVRFDVLYNNKEQSYFDYDTGVFYIDNSGQYFPISELKFGGYMGDLKAGDMLPSDYN